MAGDTNKDTATMDTIKVVAGATEAADGEEWCITNYWWGGTTKTCSPTLFPV